MVTRRDSDDPIAEFRDFVAFLSSLWGSLAGLSVVFPLSNVLANVIPLASSEDDGAFVRLSPAVVTTVSTISVLFSILWLFGQRRELTTTAVIRQQRRAALVSFIAGLGLLAVYLVVYDVKLEHAYSSWGWESDATGHLLVEVPLMAAYAGFFVLLTRGFVLLGLNEFYGTDRRGCQAADPGTDAG